MEFQLGLLSLLENVIKNVKSGQYTSLELKYLTKFLNGFLNNTQFSDNYDICKLQLGLMEDNFSYQFSLNNCNCIIEKLAGNYTIKLGESYLDLTTVDDILVYLDRSNYFN